MQLTAAIFSDPTMRPQLQQYYESKKTALIDSLKAREADPSFESKVDAEIKMPDGTIGTVSGNLMTAEMAEKSLVSFDKWVEMQERIYSFNEQRLEIAQKNLERLEKENPDSSSNVRTTFSSEGALLAYINADGSLVTHSGADFLQSIAKKANDLGLSGQSRVDYLSQEIQKELSQKFSDLGVTSYNDATSPSKREFADMWYPHFDADQNYSDAMKEAKASLDSVKVWQDQWQKNLNEMRDFLLSLQDAA
jgi:hypothetical protein